MCACLYPGSLPLETTPSNFVLNTASVSSLVRGVAGAAGLGVAGTAGLGLGVAGAVGLGVAGTGPVGAVDLGGGGVKGACGGCLGADGLGTGLGDGGGGVELEDELDAFGGGGGGARVLVSILTARFIASVSMPWKLLVGSLKVTVGRLGNRRLASFQMS